MSRRLLIAFFVLASLTWPASPARAGGVVSICDEGHLLAALSGGGTVTFTCNGTILLTNTITISTDTIIDGSGQNVTISGGGAVRVFEVDPNATLSLNELTISNGHAMDGGGIHNYGGFINVSNSTFSGNHANVYGGGIYNECCTVNVTDSTFTGNSAGLGGGIYGWGLSTIISNTIFTGNIATYTGGGIHVYGGSLNIDHSTFSANHSSGRGGAIFIDMNDLNVNHSLFSGNSASNGGGIYVAGSYVEVRTSTIFSNTATGGGGGGIYNEGGALNVESSTFTGNTASEGGGFYNTNGDEFVDAVAIVKNSTFAGNSATTRGGGIYNDDYTGMGSRVEVNSSTFSGNSAPVGQGGGIHNANDTINLGNTILTGNPGGNCAGMITSQGGNLSSPDNSCSGINSDPLLGPLQNNGGSTQTMALAPGSPAIDAGIPALCPATDQRGVTRPLDGNGDGLAICDIGAFEYLPPNLIYLPVIGGS